MEEGVTAEREEGGGGVGRGASWGYVYRLSIQTGSYDKMNKEDVLTLHHVTIRQWHITIK